MPLYSANASRYKSRVPRLRNPLVPGIGRVAQIGSSTTANGTGTVGSIPIVSYRSTLGEGNIALGSRWEIRLFGYSGAGNTEILKHLPEVLAWSPDMIVLQLAANDLNGNTEASADSALATIQTVATDLIARGICVAIHTPHFNGSNWRAVLRYDILVQEWGAYMGIPVISGAYTISSGADLIGTAKSGSMADSLHVNDLGARLYGTEWKSVIGNSVVRRILPGGSAQTLSELFVNPRMTGATAVTAGETGFSGTKAVGWTFARSGACTTVVTKGSDGDGDYMQLDITSTAVDEYITIGDATFTTTLAARPGIKLRELVDYEVVTAGAIKNVRCYMPFSIGSVQHPNGNSGNYTGVLPIGRRFLTSPLIDTAIAGAGSGASQGIRMSFGGAGTAVVRIRGCSARESRW